MNVVAASAARRASRMLSGLDGLLEEDMTETAVLDRYTNRKGQKKNSTISGRQVKIERSNSITC